jgi:hypothetical protein
LLLDGLDEVPSAYQDAVIDHIQDFVDRHANNRYIASCRSAAYHSRFHRFTDVLMADFGDEQIQGFIDRWFASPRDLEARTAQRCWQTLNAPGHAAAKELVQNPLLLTLLCLVFDDNQCFASNRAILYGEALDVLLKKWAAEKRIHRDPIYQDLSLPLEKAMLGQLAHDFFQAGRLFFPRNEASTAIVGFLADNLNAPRHLDGDTVLKAIEIQQGILVARDHSGGVMSFSHLTFQEYLTAQHLAERGDWAGLVRQHGFEVQWREVLLLAAGQARPNADGLLRAMAQHCRTMATANSDIAALFRWAQAITDGSPGAACPAAKRIAAIGLVLYLDRNLDLALARALARACDLARVLGLASALALDFFQALATQGIFNPQLATSNLIAATQHDGLKADRTKAQVAELCHRLDLPAAMLYWLRKSPTEIYACLQAYELLLDCKAAVMAVSRDAWAEIEAGLFLLDAAESPPSG